jgi:hypothetical protein
MPETMQERARGPTLAATARRDRWWVEPLWTGALFGLFVLYSTWAALQGSHYWYGSYLSPFYSPLLFVDPTAPGAAPLGHAWFGSWPTWWPRAIPASPAFLILAFPLSFRLTCYYYRKFYYRAYFWTPPACAVGALPRNDYRGETALLLFQNLHRYTLYAAIAFLAILYLDAFHAFFRNGRFGVGVGSIVLLVNPTLLALYTLGCHSFRHLVGGRLDCFSCGNAPTPRHRAWEKVSWLTARHMRFAWLSLVFVGFTDFYIRMVSMGIIRDLSTWD